MIDDFPGQKKPHKANAVETLSNLWSTFETILVVEDDVFTRLAMAEFLRGRGYIVREVCMASEAIELLSAGPLIDLIITDVRMPGKMNGFALAEWVKRYAPKVKVILTSGVATESSRGDAVELMKPFTTDLALNVIRSVLSA
jgi:CheY-like chemotaxis protein